MDKATPVVAEDSEHFSKADKAQLLQEARQCFMATSVKTKKLVNILTKCLYLLLRGDQLAQNEATDLFFHITRLFQYKDKDSTLRRLTYIGIKALSKQAENVYVVTPSLTSDINSLRDEPAIRASALRALCQISEPSTFASIEQLLKQSIVDKHPVVASAALSSLIRIASSNSDIVKKFTNEIQQALYSDMAMVQYHALGLSFNSCQNEKLPTSDLITSCINHGLCSPLAICLLIRIISNYIKNYGFDGNSSFYDYIKSHLNDKSDMVVYEAANSLVNMSESNTNGQDKKSAISYLRNFITSSKPALRFAAVRSLNELAITSTADIRFWSTHRIGGVCKLHLLNKRYRIGDHIVGILDFTNSSLVCAKYTVILQCEEIQQYELKQEFSLGLKKNDFMITIPVVKTDLPVLHCVLSFLFYISDKNYSKALFEDKAGTIELGPNELETKLYSCDLPIAIHN